MPQGSVIFVNVSSSFVAGKKKKKANITGMWNIQERVSESLASRNFMFLEKCGILKGFRKLGNEMSKKKKC